MKGSIAGNSDWLRMNHQSSGSQPFIFAPYGEGVIDKMMHTAKVGVRHKVTGQVLSAYT